MTGFAGTSRFALLRPLGSGGMGQVYEAFDREQGTPCALKLLPAVTAERLVRFKQEFRALQGLRHPNLVTLGELVEDAGHWFFTMELVVGVDFLAWVCPGSVDLGDPTVSSVTLTLDERSPMAAPPRDRSRRAVTPYDPGRLRDGLVQLAHGLAALHDAGKVHRDVKPSNILVAGDGRVVLLDFGVVADDAARDFAGTLAYMAPEQATGEPITGKTDLFAVGVILYRALTGQVPFSDLSLDGVRRRQWFRPRRPRDVCPEVPELLDELCADLLTPEPDTRPSARELVRRLGAASPPLTLERNVPFVGRQRELVQLEGAWARGRGVVVVSGPSGIGKTALIDEFLEQAEPRPLVLRGRCHEQEGIPFRAVDGVIDALGVVLDREPALAGDGEERRAMALLFPSLGVPGEPRSSSPEEDLHEQRRSAERALRAVLGRMGADRPLLVVIDDFQWADAESVALLQAVMRPPEPPRFLLLLATRGGEGAPTLGGPEDTIALGPLGTDESRSLAETFLAGEGADTVVREAAGHPLFLLELARLGPAAQGVVRLDDVLWTRVTETEPEARRLLELAAIAAAPVAQEILGHAADLGPAALSRAVAGLRVAKLVRTGGVRREDLLETWHDRIRETVSARLEGQARRAHHRRLADALAALRPEDAGARSVHLAAAGDLLGAGEQALVAGDAARQALAFERAAAHFRRAAEWLPAPVVAARRVWPRLAEALADAGLGADAATAFERAAVLAPAAEATELLRRAAEHHIRSGRVDQGADVLETVMRRVGTHLPGSSLGAFLSLALGRARIRLRGLGFRELASPRESELLRVDTLWSAAASLGAIDTIRAADCQARQLVAALDAGEPFRAARALYGEAIFLATSGPSEERRAAMLIRRADELAAKVRHPYTDAMRPFAEGILEYECGRYRAGHRGLARAAELFRASPGAAHDAAVSNRFALDCLFYMGELGEHARLVPKLLEDAERRGDLYLAAELQTGLPNVAWLCADDPRTAREKTEAGIARWSRRGFHLQHYSHLLALAQIELYRGDGAGAWRVTTEIAPGLKKSFLHHVQAVRKEALFLRGRAAVAAGEVKEAEKAAAALTEEEVPAAKGYATAVRAGIAVVKGDQSKGREMFEEAHRLLVEADAAMFAKACRRQAARLAGDAQVMAEVDREMREKGVVKPQRFAEMLVPAGGTSDPP